MCEDGFYPCMSYLSMGLSRDLCAGVVEVLVSALPGENDRVKRKLMATLGELLFFVASQEKVGLPCSWRMEFHPGKMLMGALCRTPARTSHGRCRTGSPKSSAACLTKVKTRASRCLFSPTELELCDTMHSLS